MTQTTKTDPMTRRIATAWAKSLGREFQSLEEIKIVQVAGNGAIAEDRWVLLILDAGRRITACVTPEDCARLRDHLRTVNR